MCTAKGVIMNTVCAFCALLATLVPPNPPLQPLLVLLVLLLLLLLLFLLLLANGAVGAESGWGRPVRTVGPADAVGWPVGSDTNNNNNNSVDILVTLVGRRISFRKYVIQYKLWDCRWSM